MVFTNVFYPTQQVHCLKIHCQLLMHLISESVLAVGNVGIQVTEERKWWGGRGGPQFIPLSAINDVVINEAIYRVIR